MVKYKILGGNFYGAVFSKLTVFIFLRKIFSMHILYYYNFSLRSPDATLLHGVHGRSDPTTPVLRELREVGERSVDTEGCGGVRVDQHLQKKFD